MPKHIGIVDITTVGSTICQRAIANSSSTGDHPEFSVHSLPFSRYKAALLAKDWNAMSQLAITSIQRLTQAGADFAIIPSNAPHYGYAQIAAASAIPVLNLLEITAQECATQGYRTIAVLGTKATMTGGLYDAALKANGLSTVTVPEDTQTAIDRFIMDEIIPGKTTSITTANVKKLIEQLTCDAVILGCTELPEVYGPDNLLTIPSVDTTRLLALKAVARAQS